MIHYLLYKFGPLFLFTALTLGIVGLPVPDEVLLMTSGLLIRRQKMGLLSTGFAALFGSMLGITISYLLGRWLGPLIVSKFGKPLRITPEKIELTKKWFLRAGRWLLIIGYFIPLFRHLTGFVAGATKLDYRIFALYAYFGALIWALLFLGIGYFVGEIPK